jgi:hypothetical protein
VFIEHASTIDHVLPKHKGGINQLITVLLLVIGVIIERGSGSILPINKHQQDIPNNMKLTKRVRNRYIKFCPVIGIGYWKDNYNLANVRGYNHNIILPFIRMSWGMLEGEGDQFNISESLQVGSFLIQKVTRNKHNNSDNIVFVTNEEGEGTDVDIGQVFSETM